MKYLKDIDSAKMLMKKRILSIVIPVYNEKKTIIAILAAVKSIEIPGFGKEIIVIDDFSDDGTRELLRNLHDKNIKVIYHESNYGKGAALRTGFAEAKGDIIITQDADLEYNPRDYSKLVEPIVNKSVRVVYGSRFKNRKFMSKETFSIPLHLFGNIVLSLTATILYMHPISDIETGYKLFDSRLIKNIIIKSDRFGYDPEVTVRILKMGEKIKEIPISYKPREFKEGKKITWKDGFNAFWILIKMRFNNNL